MTSDSSTANVTFGKELINETHKNICGMYDWSFLEKSLTRTSTANQEEIILPANYIRLQTYNLTDSGGNVFTPREISDPILWDNLTSQTSSTTSDCPLYFIIRSGVILNYPKITTAGLTITIEYLFIPKDMTEADYTTGTITSIANGATTVTGNGTTWTDAFVGRYIRITSDGDWYEIDSRTSDTVIELVKPYQGTTIAAATEAYTIGELPEVPEEFQDLLWYRPVGIYQQMKESEGRANFYYSGNRREPGLYESGLRDLRRKYTTQTTQNVWQDRGTVSRYNINDYPTLS